MRRRDFFGAVGAGVLACAAQQLSGLAVARGEEDGSDERDVDPAGGYDVAPPSQLLFTDLRHIDVGDLSWRTPEGEPIPVAGPPDPPVEAVADLGRLPRGIRLVAQSAGKEGPIRGLPSRVLHTDGIYRAWDMNVAYPQGENLGSYSAAEARSLAIRYGESKDGYAWDWRDGSEVKVSNVTGIDGQFFFVDPHGPAEERYKCLYNARVLSGTASLWEQYAKVHPRHRDVRISREYVYCLFGLVSPDGLQWKALPEPLMVHKGDTDNTVYYDPWLGKYVLYTRLYWLRRRMVARAESDDFRRWTPVDPIVRPRLDDPLSCDVYTNGRTSYPGLPQHHLMFPMWYRRYTQTSVIELLSSLDGIRWDRVPGGPVLAPGSPGDWDGEFIAAGKDLVPLGGDRVAIPYAGSSHPHKYPRWPGVISSGVGWAWWPKGRLAAITAEEEGQFCTFGARVTDRQLKVNAKVRRAGEIRVGLIGVNGRAASDCDPIIGDNLAHTVTWKGDSAHGSNVGDTVSLHFTLRAADLFGIEWA